MSTDLSIQQAGPKDASMLAELGAQTFKDAFGEQNNPEDMERYLAEAFTPQKMLEEIADLASSFFVAYLNREPVGYIKLRTSKQPDCIEDPSPIELERIYVHQHCIGKGVGAALMKEAVQQGKAAGFNTLWLGVWKENHQAIAFYKKWGFDVVGEHEFVVGTDVQYDHIMARTL